MHNSVLAGYMHAKYASRLLPVQVKSGQGESLSYFGNTPMSNLDTSWIQEPRVSWPFFIQRLRNSYKSKASAARERSPRSFPNELMQNQIEWETEPVIV